MTPEQKRHIRHTFQELLHATDISLSDGFSSLVKDELQRRLPGDRALIALGQDIAEAVYLTQDRLERLDQIIPQLWQIGRRRSGSTVTLAHYDLVQAVVLDLLGTCSGKILTQEARVAWLRLFDLLNETMQRAAGLSR